MEIQKLNKTNDNSLAKIQTVLGNLTQVEA